MNSSASRSNSGTDLPAGSLTIDDLGGDTILIQLEDPDGNTVPDAWISGLAKDVENHR